MKEIFNNKFKETILIKAGLIIEGRAKELVSTDTGTLRSSISPSDIDVKNMTVKIGTPISYGYYMEYGAAPHVPPFKAIEKWARRHNINPYALMNSMKKKGIKAGSVNSPFKTPSGYRPFLRPALHQSVPRIREMISKELKKEINKIKK